MAILSDIQRARRATTSFSKNDPLSQESECHKLFDREVIRGFNCNQIVVRACAPLIQSQCFENFKRPIHVRDGGCQHKHASWLQKIETFPATFDMLQNLEGKNRIE